MSNIKRSILSGLIVVCGAGIPGAGLHAQDLGNGWEPNMLEIAKLPPYCQQYFLTKALPPNCDGVHHLCAGRVLMNRVMNTSIPKQERQRIFRRAKQEVDYIFGRKNPSCQMMDEARAAQSSLVTLEMFVR